MIFTVLRVQGDFPTEDFLNHHSLNVCAVWRKGEPGQRGLVHADSGFNISLPDEKLWPMALFAIQNFLEDKQRFFDDLRSFSARVTLDIGVTVGEQQAYAPSIEIPKDMLARFVSLGIDLNISAYPTTEAT